MRTPCSSICSKSPTKRTTFQPTTRGLCTTCLSRSGFGCTPWQRCVCWSSTTIFSTNSLPAPNLSSRKWIPDSLYFTISSESLEEIFLPGMCRTFYKERHLWLPSEQYSNCKTNYIAAKVDNKPWLLKHCSSLISALLGFSNLSFKVKGFCCYVQFYICVRSSGNKLAHKGLKLGASQKF